MQFLNFPFVGTLSASLESFLKLIVTLLIFVFVLVITYLTTKWIGGYQKIRTKSKNLQVVETIPVGNNKMISLIKAGKLYLVVSIGKDEIHSLGTLTEDQLADLSFLYEGKGSTQETESFQDILGQLKEKMSSKPKEKNSNLK